MKCSGTFAVRENTHLDGSKSVDPEPKCSYCGSWSVTAVLKAFQTAGTNWSGCDWKYGYPHKFYVSIPIEPVRRCIGSSWIDGARGDFRYSEVKSEFGKFYSVHLLDATTEQREEWRKHVEPLIGVVFEMHGSELKYRAPSDGYQAHGIIGEPHEVHS